VHVSVISFPAAFAHATAARANAKRFAEAVIDEPDDVMKAYLRNLAVSWNRIAEQHEFLADVAAHKSGS
jgi:hypothetical protein